MMPSLIFKAILCIGVWLADVGDLPARIPLQSVEASPATFRHDDRRLGQKLFLALGFLSFVAGCAFVAVKLQRNGALRKLPTNVSRRAACRVLDFKRVTAKLIIVTVELPGGGIITLADNGNTLKILSRTEPSVSSASPVDGANHAA